MPRHNTTTWQFEMSKMAEPDGIVAVVKQLPLDKENIGMFSKS